MMHAEQDDALVDHTDGERVRLCGRGPPAPLLICWSAHKEVGE